MENGLHLYHPFLVSLTTGSTSTTLHVAIYSFTHAHSYTGDRDFLVWCYLPMSGYHLYTCTHQWRSIRGIRASGNWRLWHLDCCGSRSNHNLPIPAIATNSSSCHRNKVTPENCINVLICVSIETYPTVHNNVPVIPFTINRTLLHTKSMGQPTLASGVPSGAFEKS